MKRRIILTNALCIMLMLLCSACGLFGPQKYVCDVDEVETIQIVKLDDYVEGEYRYEYTILTQITDYKSFVARLNGLKHSVNWGDPQQLYEGYVVIKINYRNGDFDLVHPSAQWFSRSGAIRTGYFFFDEKQFDALISAYMTE